MRLLWAQEAFPPGRIPVRLGLHAGSKNLGQKFLTWLLCRAAIADIHTGLLTYPVG